MKSAAGGSSGHRARTRSRERILKLPHDFCERIIGVSLELKPREAVQSGFIGHHGTRDFALVGRRGARVLIAGQVVEYLRREIETEVPAN